MSSKKLTFSSTSNVTVYVYSPNQSQSQNYRVTTGLPGSASITVNGSTTSITSTGAFNVPTVAGKPSVIYINGRGWTITAPDAWTFTAL